MIIRAGIAILFLATAVTSFDAAYHSIGGDTAYLNEVPAHVRLSHHVWLIIQLAGGAGFLGMAVLTLRGFSEAPKMAWLQAPVLRAVINTFLAVVLSMSAMSALFTLDMYANYVWPEKGGLPAYLISIGWGSNFGFFIYDAIRFCLISFLAVWPVTFLRPQRPVLYSIAIMGALIVLFTYWVHLTSWTDLPRRALWTPWLVLIHVLSIPAMYQLHIWLQSRTDRSSESGAPLARAG